MDLYKRETEYNIHHHSTPAINETHQCVSRANTEISNRELEVLSRIADGLNTKEISKILIISTHTVESHRKNLLRKFGAKNSAELIKKASKMFWFE